MTYSYKNGQLHGENVALSDIADKIGTPCYIYSSEIITNQVKKYREAIENPWPSDQKPWFGFACKSNSNLAVLRLLGNLGAGMDIVSGGELQRCLAVGIDPDKIVFSGVGKTAEELTLALKTGIHQINAETVQELDVLDGLTRDLNLPCRVALRYTPDVESEAHAKTSTGSEDNKFGLTRDEVFTLFKSFAGHPYIKVEAISMHIGSGLPRLDPFAEAFNKMANLVKELRAEGHTISQVDLGGGLWVPYEDEPVADVKAYGQMIYNVFAPLDVQIVLEPGRFLIAEGGLLLTKVIYTKDRATKNFAVVDAAMNDLIRPTLYEAYHQILPVTETAAKKTAYDVVGPVCETGDYLALDRELPTLKSGDLLAVMTAGAYGAAMSSAYNTRPLIPEILIDGDKFTVIRKSQPVEDLWAYEIIPDSLK